MTDTTYNGWTNRATWLVALWMNEEDFIGEQQRNRASEIEESEVRNMVIDWVYFQRQFRANADYGFMQDMDGEKFTDINYSELAENFAYDINSIFEE